TLTIVEGESTNISFAVTSSNAPLVAVEFSATNPPPSFAVIANLEFTNTPPAGYASAQLVLQPAIGEAGSYLVTLQAAGVFGSNSVSVTTNVVVKVTPNLALVSTRWRRAVDGNWSDPSRWTDGLPGPSKPAVVDLPGSYTVTLDTNATIHSLSMGGA